jgi:hypothetical protein
MSKPFRLLMIGAMYENGGNTTHRFLDGHPQLYVYPFESQIGTRLVDDHLSAAFPLKYRWPVFALDATPEQDFHAIIDEEAKVRSRTPFVSKFREYPFDMNDEERKTIYGRIVRETGRSVGNNVLAFFAATFEAWQDVQRSDREEMYVGYSPIIGVDGARILSDLPDAHVLHVVRNPWSAYADTKKRPVPLSLPAYMLGWTLNQYYALLNRARHPDRFHIIRVEDVMADPATTLGALCDGLGLERSASLATPTWNGAALDQVYPWGTIRAPTPAANHATSHELSREEQTAVSEAAWQYLEPLGYGDYLRAGMPRPVSL